MKKNVTLIFVLLFFGALMYSQNTDWTPFSSQIGLGTTTPSSKFHIKSNTNVAFRIETTGFGWAQLGVARYSGAYSPLSVPKSVILRAFTSENFIITQQGGGDIQFATRTISGDDNTENYRMTITSEGNVGIGKTDPTDKLEVNGRIHARSVKVDLDGWPDYVFLPEYRLPPLEEVAKFIKKNGHLENVPSAEKIINGGLDLGAMDKILMEKVEELTLYLIEKEEEIQEIKKEKDELTKTLEILVKKVAELELKMKS